MTITNLKTAATQTVTIEEAAEIMQLGVEEIEWAIEEHGVCSTDEYSVVAV